MISRKLKRGGKPKTSICPSKKNMETCAEEASCKWNAARSKCRKSRVAKKNGEIVITVVALLKIRLI